MRRMLVGGRGVEGVGDGEVLGEAERFWLWFWFWRGRG